MTNTTTSTFNSTPAQGATGDGEVDPRPLFSKAVGVTESVIPAIEPKQLDDPTPCDELDVRGLLGHLVTVLRRVAAVGRDEDAFGPATMAHDVVGDDWGRAWRDEAQEAQAAWADGAALTTIVRLPWAEIPGAAVLCGYLNEIVVHTWDLATATGQPQPAWDPAVLEAAFDAISRVLPAEGRTEMFASVLAKMPPEAREGVSPPFAEAVTVPDDAPLLDRLVAWNGRQP